MRPKEAMVVVCLAGIVALAQLAVVEQPVAAQEVAASK